MEVWQLFLMFSVWWQIPAWVEVFLSFSLPLPSHPVSVPTPVSCCFLFLLHLGSKAANLREALNYGAGYTYEELILQLRQFSFLFTILLSFHNGSRWHPAFSCLGGRLLVLSPHWWVLPVVHGRAGSETPFDWWVSMMCWLLDRLNTAPWRDITSVIVTNSVFHIFVIFIHFVSVCLT